jgi:hypothetical protein
MHGSRSKIPSKNIAMQRWAEGFNSGVKGLNMFGNSLQTVMAEPLTVKFISLHQIWKNATYYDKILLT